MGHKIDDDYRLKSDYASDPSLLYKLWKRIETGPYSVYCSKTTSLIEEAKINFDPLEREFTHDAVLHFQDIFEWSKILLQIVSDEPSDNLKISFKDKVEGTYSVGCNTEMKDNVVILKKHIKALFAVAD